MLEQNISSKEQVFVNETHYILKYSILCGVLNICLFSLKLISGLYVHSITIIGDGINNLTDIGSILFSCIGILLANFEAGKYHPFGHGRIKWIFGLLSSFCISFMGLELFRKSLITLKEPNKLRYSIIVVIVLGISILVKFYLFFLNLNISNRFKLISFKAVAIDSLSDAISTGVVLLAYLIQHFFEWSIDGGLGIVVSIIILRNGTRITIDIFGRILGRRVDKNKYEIIKKIIFKYPEVINCYDIMIHDYGLDNLFINLNILVKSYECNKTLSEQIQYEIYTALGYSCVIHEEFAITDTVLANSLYESIIEKIMSAYGEDLKIENFRMLEGNYVIFDLLLPTTCLQNKDDILKTIKDQIIEKVSNAQIVIQSKIYNNYKTILYKRGEQS